MLPALLNPSQISQTQLQIDHLRITRGTHGARMDTSSSSKQRITNDRVHLAMLPKLVARLALAGAFRQTSNIDKLIRAGMVSWLLSSVSWSMLIGHRQERRGLDAERKAQPAPGRYDQRVEQVTWPHWAIRQFRL